jgi:cytochrome c5
MALEDAILELAAAIQMLANSNAAAPVAQLVPLVDDDASSSTVAVCMDSAGVPTTFKRRCGICGEAGRYRSTHKDEMRDGTHHWVEVKA